MIIKEIYSPETGVQNVWYDSSSIFFSSFDENTRTLHVVFNNGTAYDYFNVDLASDYMLFKNGYVDGSQGKSLNKFIKGKYDYLKVDDENIEELKDMMNKVNEEPALTIFVSGHRNISKEEFLTNYAPVLELYATQDEETNFVIGDYYGADIMAQNFLVDELSINPDRITVYHMFEQPRNINPKIKNTKGGFKTDEERDAAMTNDSTIDVAFVKSHLELSGTAMNILRRNLLK